MNVKCVRCASTGQAIQSSIGMFMIQNRLTALPCFWLVNTAEWIGADVNAVHHGMTALLFACMSADLPMVRLLVNEGADVNCELMMTSCLDFIICEKDRRTPRRVRV